MWNAIEHGLTEAAGFLVAALSLFVVNRLGFISRKSVFWKSISFFAVILIDCAVFVGTFTDGESPFTLSITVDDSRQIDKVKIAKTPIALSLHGGHVGNDSLFYLDDENREYRAILPKPLTVGTSEMTLTPATALLGYTTFSWNSGMDVYWIRPLGSRWIVVTDMDFIILFFLVPGSVLLWYGGTQGKDPPELEE